jgi:DNA repair protein RadC
MGVPTKEELDIALNEAARMREQGDDPCHLGKVLLNHNYRIELLEKVLQAAELYLHSGQGSHEHSQLLRAIEVAKKSASDAESHDVLDYGL